MRSRIKIGNLAIPSWLLVLTLIAVGAGAAAGTVLRGEVIGEMPVTVSQALLVGKPVAVPSDADWTVSPGPVIGVIRQTLYPKAGHVAPDRWIGTVSDDQTAFQFAAEVDTGDRFLIALPLKNASGYDIVVELTIIFPDGLFVEVFGSDEEMTAATNYTQHVTRTGLYTWKFILKKGAEKQPYNEAPYWRDNIGILVAVADDAKPGFYRIEGKLKQISY